MWMDMKNIKNNNINVKNDPFNFFKATEKRQQINFDQINEKFKMTEKDKIIDNKNVKNVNENKLLENQNSIQFHSLEF